LLNRLNRITLVLRFALQSSAEKRDYHTLSIILSSVFQLSFSSLRRSKEEVCRSRPQACQQRLAT
jgi:hypothetical protein